MIKLSYNTWYSSQPLRELEIRPKMISSLIRMQPRQWICTCNPITDSFSFPNLSSLHLVKTARIPKYLLAIPFLCRFSFPTNFMDERLGRV